MVAVIGPDPEPWFDKRKREVAENPNKLSAWKIENDHLYFYSLDRGDQRGGHAPRFYGPHRLGGKRSPVLVRDSRPQRRVRKLDRLSLLDEPVPRSDREHLPLIPSWPYDIPTIPTLNLDLLIPRVATPSNPTPPIVLPSGPVISGAIMPVSPFPQSEPQPEVESAERKSIDNLSMFDELLSSLLLRLWSTGRDKEIVP